MNISRLKTRLHSWSVRCHRISVRLYFLVFSAGALLLYFRGYRSSTSEVKLRPINVEWSQGIDLSSTEEPQSVEPFNERVSCQFPRLDPLDPSILPLVVKPEPISCKEIQPYLSYIDRDGFLVLNCSDIVSRRLNDVRCQWQTIDKTFMDTIFHPTRGHINVGDRVDVSGHDAVEVHCAINGSTVYFNVHAHPKKLKIDLHDTTEENLSVVLLVLESTSQNMMRRYAPRTFAYLTETMGFTIFNGYTKVADNSFPNMMAVLTGKRAYNEQPDMPAELGDTAGPFGSWDLLFSRFRQQGYVTSYLEDEPKFGLFTYYARGFDDKPTDHYFRPYFLARDGSRVLAQSSQYCFGNTPKYKSQINVLKRLLERYKAKRQFIFAFFVELTHDDDSGLGRADDMFEDFFTSANRDGLFNKTAVVVLGDHGHRFSKLRQTLTGFFEERLPLLGIYFPAWFHAAHPQLKITLEMNRERLSSSYDVHQTLLDILHANYTAQQVPSSSRSLSLLNIIPANRTCLSAGIPDYYCVCSPLTPLASNDSRVALAAGFLVDHMNDLLTSHSQICATLNLTDVLRAEIREDNVGSDFLAKTKIHIQIRAGPSDGIFEAMVHLFENGTLSIPNAVSRVNGYGDQSWCVSDVLLRRYCFCTVAAA